MSLRNPKGNVPSPFSSAVSLIRRFFQDNMPGGGQTIEIAKESAIEIMKKAREPLIGSKGGIGWRRVYPRNLKLTFFQKTSEEKYKFLDVKTDNFKIAVKTVVDEAMRERVADEDWPGLFALEIIVDENPSPNEYRTFSAEAYFDDSDKEFLDRENKLPEEIAKPSPEKSKKSSSSPQPTGSSDKGSSNSAGDTIEPKSLRRPTGSSAKGHGNPGGDTIDSKLSFNAYAYLTVEAGDVQPHCIKDGKILINKPSFNIGRTSQRGKDGSEQENHCAFEAEGEINKTVSRHHARIDRVEKKLVLFDTGSKWQNTVILRKDGENTKHLWISPNEYEYLQNGDKIMLGDAVLVFHMEK
ncbi:MAG: FHA domain-containing protein [Holophagaceae bacterium]|nr:FHA domain-containing protein [Holophagaceae bacterium]